MPETATVANCRFYVQIGGQSSPTAVFTEVSGLQSEVEVYDYQEGGANDIVHRMPGRVKVTNLTLKRGITASPDLNMWYEDVIKGNILRKEVAVYIFDSKQGYEVGVWRFRNAYPVKWTGPQLIASGNAIAVETLELAHEGMNYEPGIDGFTLE